MFYMKCDVVFIAFLAALIKLKYSSVILGRLLYLCFIYGLKRILSGGCECIFLVRLFMVMHY